MKVLQRVIKYLAIAFALLLVFNIISGIMYGFSFIGNILNDNKSNIKDNLKDLEINSNSIILDINVLSSNITIKSGTELKAETNNDKITTKQENNKLYIEEKNNYFHDNNSELIIYIPKDFTFDGVSIETGAGKVIIEELNTKILYLNLGAGKVEIDNLNVLEETTIDGGAGKIEINANTLHNLSLNMGVGKVSLKTKLTGNNSIEAGIGKLDLNLIGTKEDYKISIEKGIGEIKIDGKNIKDETIYGNGNNIIDIEGGIGSISVELIK